MKVGFDVSQTGAGKAGCGYFAEGLIRALEALGGEHRYVLHPAFGDLFWDPSCATAAYSTSNPRFERIKAPASFEESQRFWREPGADFESRIGSPDLVHSNNFFCYLRGLRRARLVSHAARSELSGGPPDHRSQSHRLPGWSLLPRRHQRRLDRGQLRLQPPPFPGSLPALSGRADRLRAPRQPVCDRESRAAAPRSLRSAWGARA